MTARGADCADFAPSATGPAATGPAATVPAADPDAVVPGAAGPAANRLELSLRPSQTLSLWQGKLRMRMPR